MRSTILLVLIFIGINNSLFSQNNNLAKFIGGLSINYEYDYTAENVYNQSSIVPGIFAQIRLGKRISALSTFSFTQQSYKSLYTNLSFCGLSIFDPNFIEEISRDARISSLSLENLIKFYFWKKQVSYFLGGGMILSIPRKLDLEPSTRNTPNHYSLPKNGGTQIALGVECTTSKRIFLSSSIKWNNIFNSNIYNSNRDNFSINVSVGVILDPRAN